MSWTADQWDILKQDVRHAVRTLTRTPGFAITATLVIAIGIGANTAAFSVADFVLLRPLPFRDPDSLVRLCEGPRQGGGWGCMNELSPSNYRDLKDRSASFEALGAFASSTVNLVGGGEPQRLTIAPVTAEVLRILAVSPFLGRVFAPDGDDDRNTAVISYGLWQSQFGGNPGVLGQTASLDGTPHTIIGVMPPTFYFPTRDVEMWTPLVFREEEFASRTNTYIQAVGRLRPGVTFEQARAELSTLADALARDYPDTNAETGISFFRLRDNMSPRFRLMLISLGGASLCLLLLTCANLANLLLARAAAGERELAVRAALGAGRDRLVRQLLTHTVLLTLAGSLAGVLVAVVTVPLFSALVPSTLPVAAQPGVNLRVLAVAAAFTALIALLFGIFPALGAGRAGFAALREGSRGGSGQKQRIRGALIALEVAVSVALLITSGLLIRAVWRVHAVDAGFVSTDVLTLRTSLPRPKYDSPFGRAAFYDRVLSGVRALPGVQSAAFTSGLPMVVTGLVTGVEVPGYDVRGARTDVVSHRWVTPQYFRTLGVPLRRGRDVEDADTRDRPWVAVISESFAARYWPDQDPIGQTFRHRGNARTVVGVVGDVKVRGLERTSEPQLYLPAEQIADGWPAAFDPKDLVVRHSGPTEPLAAAVRRVVRAADPEQPISDIRTMDAVLAGDTAPRRAQLQVLGVLAFVAVLLSGVGIYGLLAYTVSQRGQEIGVRLALGADPARVGRMIVADGMRLALVGAVPGVFGAYAAGRGMSALLFGIAPGDPLTFATATGVAAFMTFAGAVVPALRAMRVTPMSVLKAE
jgi:predicted permease